MDASSTRDGDPRVPRPAIAKFRWVVTLARCAAIGAAVLTLNACVGHIHMSFLDPQGPVARAEMVHFYWVLGIMAVFVAGPIFLALPFLLWRYRYGNPKAVGYAPKWKDVGIINFLTWAGPVGIVIVLGFFVWRDSHRLDPYKPLVSNQPALQLQVIGYDWKWLVIYPKQHIATIGTLVMPVGRPLSIHLTSATVMKSFFIPALGSQIYAMGGMVTRLNLQASKPGRFLGENTMYDGNGFHNEKFVAVAKSPAEFKAWVHKVQVTGVPLDRDILTAISQRTTREQLVALMPRTAVHSDKGVRGDDVYLTGVSGELFPRVVKALKEDTPPAAVSLAGAGEPEPAGATAGSAAAAKSNGTAADAAVRPRAARKSEP